MRTAPSEHQEQAFLMQWCDLHRNKYIGIDKIFAIPNGAKVAFKKVGRGKSFSPEGQKLNREGRKKGVPDLCLPVARGGYFGLYLEMKSETGEVSDDQKLYLDWLNAYGYLGVAAWGADDAVKILEWYYTLPRTFPSVPVVQIPSFVKSYNSKPIKTRKPRVCKPKMTI